MVSNGQIDAPIVLAGSVLATAAPVIVSAPATGAVRSIEIDVRSIVRAGDVLARIDPAA